MRVSGKLFKILERKKLDAKSVFKQEFVIMVNDNPKYKSWPVKFTIVNDENIKVNILDNFKIGDNLVVDFQLKGREAFLLRENKTGYFNTLRVIKVEKE